MATNSLPLELIERILVYLDPIHVSKFAQTCRGARRVVYGPGDEWLWREMYLALPLDDPRVCVWMDGEEVVAREVQRIVRAWTVVENVNVCRGVEEYVEVVKTMLDVVSCVPVLKVGEAGRWSGGGEVSKNLLWGSAVMKGGGFLDFVEGGGAGISLKGMKREERMMKERLHTYFGVTEGDVKGEGRVRCQAYVYDMGRYGWENEFGPFDEVGRVDWEHVRMLKQVMTLKGSGGEEGEGGEEEPVLLMSLPFTQIMGVEAGEWGGVRDWAGVAGRWKVSYIFSNYHDLMSEWSFRTGELDTSIFETESFREVYRVLDVDLMITHTVPDEEHPKWPVIYFAGEMLGTSSTMTGHVKMTPDKQVKWSFVSVGVQIGGLRSAYGIIGAWTTIFHDDGDPIGPFWLRAV
ncbi:hypothetical protein AMATHDRAFT_75080 [Amanita thiersii Skay4041]|uniref:F-box domain-containing protein n=1 Tax=Amanita thiersii Skay4041 TaxID=703135 RepID=A0A2A9NU70_9AGAR|nr:hypothetical protein AMATHDRAFT_75080 [Amanita thiersii Skay4041]